MGEFPDVWRANCRVPKVFEVAIAAVIEEDEDDVGAVFYWTSRGTLEREQGHQRKQEKEAVHFSSRFDRRAWRAAQRWAGNHAKSVPEVRRWPNLERRSGAAVGCGFETACMVPCDGVQLRRFILRGRHHHC